MRNASSLPTVEMLNIRQADDATRPARPLRSLAIALVALARQELERERGVLPPALSTPTIADDGDRN
jgi:hypothetical protein